MQIDLPVNNFSFFKIITGLILLAVSVIFPVAGLVSLAILAIGKAHSIGAWLGMWRAGKLNYKLLLWIVFVIIATSYYGLVVSDYSTLWFVGALLFTFHYLFDELELQETDKNIQGFISAVTPFLVFSIYIVYTYLRIPIHLDSIILLIVIVTAIELLVIKKINWFFIQSKILLLYIVYAIYNEVSAHYVLAIFLLSHYIFWFIYPVYKLHKYKREERDGFIIVLIVIALSSVFVYSTRIWGQPDLIDEIALRSFSIASIVHVLTTAPFAYLFGLPRPKIFTRTV